MKYQLRIQIYEIDERYLGHGKEIDDIAYDIGQDHIFRKLRYGICPHLALQLIKYLVYRIIHSMSP